MLNILKPEGAFIIYRVSLIRTSSLNFGKWCRESIFATIFIQNVDKINRQKKIQVLLVLFFVFLQIICYRIHDAKSN